MAVPRVFVSSTCYDLKYIRENIKYFIKTLGYEPVLSEDGAVFFNPVQHTHDSCLSEVPNCQMFVLIIGGRYGGLFKDKVSSITNEEYRMAIKQKIPVFALVESSVYSDHHVYNSNRKNEHVDESKINYPSVDNIKIFKFIDEVRSASVNNAIVPFKDFSDIEAYLKQQWAGMMFSYLTADNESQRIASTLLGLEEVNERIEMISRKILESVGTEETNIEAELFSMMISTDVLRSLSYWKLVPTPASILKNTTFKSCAKSLGLNMKVNETDLSSTIGESGTISKPKFDQNEKEYKELRKKMINFLASKNYSVDTFLGQKA